MVSVFNHPELAVASGTIDGQGDLAVPLVGNVPIAGLEPDAAAGDGAVAEAGRRENRRG